MTIEEGILSPSKSKSSILRIGACNVENITADVWPVLV